MHIFVDKNDDICYTIDGGERVLSAERRFKMAKKMSRLEKSVAEYKELKALLKEVQDEIEKRESALKAELEKRGVSELAVGDSVVRNTAFVSKRFDSKGFKVANPALYEEFVKEVEGHRFSVA